MNTIDPDWTAPRAGHDWREENILLATGWLRGFVPAAEMSRRIDAVRAHLLAYRQAIRDEGFARFEEPADRAAWQVADSDDAAHSFRHDAAQCSGLMPPT